MKQVTIESVKQRINELTYTGVVSLRGEFELACLRELVAVTEQRDALVVENATLREAAEFAIAPDMWEELGGNVLRYQYQEWYADKLKAALTSTATSSAIAALRAEGVEMFAKDNEAWAQHYEEHGVRDGSADRRNLIAYEARNFARQLRESKGAQS